MRNELHDRRLTGIVAVMMTASLLALMELPVRAGGTGPTYCPGPGGQQNTAAKPACCGTVAVAAGTNCCTLSGY